MSHQRLIKDTLLTLITLVIFGSTNFLFNVIVGRVYGSAYLGTVSAALSTTLLMSYVVSTSFPSAVAKYTSEYLGKGKEDYANHVLFTAVKYGAFIGLVMTLIALLFLNSICKIFNLSPKIFLISIPLIFLYGIYMIFKMAYYGFRQVNKYFRNEIMADSLFFASLGVIALFRWNTYIYLPYILLYSFFILSAFYFFRHRLREVKHKKKEIEKKFFTYAGIAFVGTFSSMAMRNLSIMISSAYVLPSEVGYLSAAFSLSTLFFLFPNALGRVLMPEFSFRFGGGNSKDITRLLNKSTEYLLVFVTLINSLGIIFAPLIVTFFYSYKYNGSILLFQILLVGFWVVMVSRPAVSSLSGTRYISILAINGLIALGISLLLWILITPLIGIVGVAIVYSLGVGMGVLLNLVYVVKYYSYRIEYVFKHFVFLFLVFIVSIMNFPLILKYLLSLCILMVYAVIYREKLLIILNSFVSVLFWVKRK